MFQMPEQSKSSEGQEQQQVQPQQALYEEIARQASLCPTFNSAVQFQLVCALQVLLCAMRVKVPDEATLKEAALALAPAVDADDWGFTRGFSVLGAMENVLSKIECRDAVSPEHIERLFCFLREVVKFESVAEEQKLPSKSVDALNPCINAALDVVLDSLQPPMSSLYRSAYLTSEANDAHKSALAPLVELVLRSRNT